MHVDDIMKSIGRGLKISISNIYRWSSSTIPCLTLVYLLTARQMEISWSISQGISVDFASEVWMWGLEKGS